MLKHMEDRGDLNVLADNNGSMLLVCASCGQMWTGKFGAVYAADSKQVINKVFSPSKAADRAVFLDVGVAPELVDGL